ncbi:MAG: hypothetical protein FJY88_02535 [Candidatus Eisenbacteria bacterium]|nr:hypothetical protein [Candidatus Eisenbacteria bacterium]
MEGTTRHEPRFPLGKKPFGEYVADRYLRWSGFYEQYDGHTESGIPIGIKIVSAEWAPQTDRLAAASRPFSRGLVSVFDFKRLPAGDVVVITEVVSPTLREKLDAGSLPQIAAAGYLRDLAEACFAIDNQGGVLPLLSPESIAIREDGAKIDDHYLHALFPNGKVPIVLEYAPYLAPQMEQDPPTRSDILFMLGILYYEMLCGSPPFRGSSLSVIASTRTKDVEVERIPPAARPLVRRLLARDQRNRMSSLTDLLRSLDATLGRVTADGGPAPDLMEEILATPAAEAAALEEMAGPRLLPLGKNAQGLREFKRSADGGVMVLIPAGSFAMGTPEGRPEEGPPVTVEVEPFLIDKYPVTWEMFAGFHQGHDRSCDFCSQKTSLLPSRFMTTPQAARGVHDQTEFERRLASVNDAISRSKGEAIPVSFLTAAEMDAYAAAQGCELPSEAEWEYACRGAALTRYPWGDEPDPKRAWYLDGSGGLPHPVGLLSPNGYGLYDMAGNVSETCRDLFVKEIYEMISAGAASAEELTEGVTRPSPRRSMRGGSYASSAAGVSVTFRAGLAGDIRSETRGMRLSIRKSRAPDWMLSAFAEGGSETPEAGAGVPPAMSPGSAAAEAPEKAAGEETHG